MLDRAEELLAEAGAGQGADASGVKVGAAEPEPVGA
jgi:hypothetical protein